MVADGHEIALHGYRWINYRNVPYQVKNTHRVVLVVLRSRFVRLMAAI